MCVRYTLHKPDAAIVAIAKALGVHLDSSDWLQPRYNVAPSQTMPIVMEKARVARVQSMRWGLLPPADRDQVKKRTLTNARAETMTQWPAFRTAAAQRRCLVPANGFYEFKDVGWRKEPYVFMLRDEKPFALAGLWEEPLEGMPPTFCIVTTEPNATMEPIHHRMPLVLTAETMGRWLGEGRLPEKSLEDLTRPVSAELLIARRVNTHVNYVRHEGPMCLAPPEEDPPELALG